MITFHAYRLSLIENSKVSSLKSKGLVKEHLFYNQIQRLEGQQKIQFISRGTKHFLFFVKKYSETLHAIELAKEEVYPKPIEGEFRIEVVSDKRAPFIYIILDVARQIMLVQEKRSVFQDFETPKNRMESFLNDQLEYIGITVLLKPITNKKDFFKEVRTLDKIYDFGITLNAPNLFKGRHKANEFVKEVHEEYNFTEFKLWFKNQVGNLKLLKENTEEFISLVASGGGRYFLKGLRNGKKVIVTSFNFIMQKIYDSDDIHAVSAENIQDDLEELNRMNEDIQEDIK